MVADEVAELIPDEDDIENWTTEMAIAENAMASVHYALRCAVTSEVERAAFAARQGIEAADSLANENVDFDWNASGREAEIANSKEVLDEIRAQMADLALAKSVAEVVVIHAIRRRSTEE